MFHQKDTHLHCRDNENMLSTRHNLNVNDEWKIIFIVHYNLEKRFPQVQKQSASVLR